MCQSELVINKDSGRRKKQGQGKHRLPDVCLVKVSKAQDRSAGVEGKRCPGKQGRFVWLQGHFCQSL